MGGKFMSTKTVMVNRKLVAEKVRVRGRERGGEGAEGRRMHVAWEDRLLE